MDDDLSLSVDVVEEDNMMMEDKIVVFTEAYGEIEGSYGNYGSVGLCRSSLSVDDIKSNSAKRYEKMIPGTG